MPPVSRASSAPPRTPTRIATRSFGGGGYLRFRSGEYTRKNNEITWATAFNYYLNRKLAVVGDARGSFGNAHAITNNIYGVYKPQINEYTFMGGVSYRFYAKEKLAVSAQGLGGTGWGIFSGGSKGIPGPDLGLWNDGFRPAFSAGVSADYNLYPNLAVRVYSHLGRTNFVGPTGSTASEQHRLQLRRRLPFRPPIALSGLKSRTAPAASKGKIEACRKAGNPRASKSSKPRPRPQALHLRSDRRGAARRSRPQTPRPGPRNAARTRSLRTHLQPSPPQRPRTRPRHHRARTRAARLVHQALARFAQLFRVSTNGFACAVGVSTTV